MRRSLTQKIASQIQLRYPKITSELKNSLKSLPILPSLYFQDISPILQRPEQLNLEQKQQFIDEEYFHQYFFSIFLDCFHFSASSHDFSSNILIQSKLTAESIQQFFERWEYILNYKLDVQQKLTPQSFLLINMTSRIINFTIKENCINKEILDGNMHNDEKQLENIDPFDFFYSLVEKDYFQEEQKEFCHQKNIKQYTLKNFTQEQLSTLFNAFKQYPNQIPMALFNQKQI